MTNFPTKLRTLRKRLGLSQAQAGQVLGLSRQAIALYESGDRSPPDEPVAVRSKTQILDALERAAKREQ